MDDIKKKIILGSGSAATGLGLMFSYVNAETATISRTIDTKTQEVRTYVDLKHESVEKRLTNIENLLIKIDDRLYLIHKTKYKEGR